MRPGKHPNTAFWLRRCTLYAVIISLVSLALPRITLADLNLGIFPRRKPEATLAAFKPLAEYLSYELGQPVNLLIHNSFSGFWKAIELQEFDLVHFNQYHYIRSHREYGYKVIATNVEYGQNRMKSIIAVRKDSRITQLQDLRGQVVLFGGNRMAMAAYIMPTFMLKRAGLDPNSDYREEFAKNPLLAVTAVYAGHAEASASGDAVLQMPEVKTAIKIDDMTLLAESEPYPQLPWAVKANMDPKLLVRIQQLLFNLPKQAKSEELFQRAEIDRFETATDADFDELRKIVKQVLGESY